MKGYTSNTIEIQFVVYKSRVVWRWVMAIDSKATAGKFADRLKLKACQNGLG